MVRKHFVSLLLSLFASSPLLAQAGRITGAVTSAEGARPIANVHVVVVGTRLGTVTGDDGRYNIAADPGTYTVRASRIGLVPDSLIGVVVTSGASTTADFQMRVSVQVLGEVVAIGYGTQQ